MADSAQKVIGVSVLTTEVQFHREIKLGIEKAAREAGFGLALSVAETRVADQAIQIAREHVRFEVGRVEAVRANERGHRVWRVTLHHRPDDGGDADSVVLAVDRDNGRYLGAASN